MESWSALDFNFDGLLDGGQMIPIFVISLADSIRRAVCREQLERLGLTFQFYDAVDGQKLSPSEINASYDTKLNASKFKRTLSSAEIACYLSHKRLWEISATEGTPVAILEDDFLLAAGFGTFIDGLPTALVKQQVIKLDGRDDMRRGLRPAGAGHLNTVWIGPFDVIPPCTAGYIIGPEAAKKMLQARKTFYRPIDIDFKHYWEHKVPILGVSPPLVTQRLAASESLLEDGRNSLKPASKIRRFFRNIRYQADFRLKLWTHPHPHDDPTLKELQPPEK